MVCQGCFAYHVPFKKTGIVNSGKEKKKKEKNPGGFHLCLVLGRVRLSFFCCCCCFATTALAARQSLSESEVRLRLTEEI